MTSTLCFGLFNHYLNIGHGIEQVEPSDIMAHRFHGVPGTSRVRGSQMLHKEGGDVPNPENIVSGFIGRIDHQSSNWGILRVVGIFIYIQIGITGYYEE